MFEISADYPESQKRFSAFKKSVRLLPFCKFSRNTALSQPIPNPVAPSLYSQALRPLIKPEDTSLGVESELVLQKRVLDKDMVPESEIWFEPKFAT